MERPISISKKARRRLLEPGYWGYLEEEVVEFIQATLQENPDLSHAWAFSQYRNLDPLQRFAE